MVRHFSVVIILLLAAGTAASAQHQPWEWQKDQNKYALYEDDMAPSYRVLARYFVDPPTRSALIYVDNKKAYRDYAGHVALSYRALYRLTARQHKLLYRGLMEQYNVRGIKAADVHSFLEMQLERMLSAEKYAHWQRIKIYPEYDPYYLEWGRSLRDVSY